MNPEKKLPIWQQIHNALSREIATGLYSKGQKLPTEAAFALRFNVNRHTIRRALAVLQEEGHIHVRQGAGAFVSHSQIDYRLGKKTRFSQNLAQTGLETRRQILRLETLPAPQDARDTLKLSDGARVHILEAVSMVDGAPFSYSKSMFPAARFANLCEALRDSESITAALAANGVADYHRSWTQLTAKKASGTVARVLHLPENEPVLRTVSLNIDTTGAPIEYGRTWFHGERAQLVVEGDAV